MKKNEKACGGALTFSHSGLYYCTEYTPWDPSSQFENQL